MLSNACRFDSDCLKHPVMRNFENILSDFKLYAYPVQIWHKNVRGALFWPFRGSSDDQKNFVYDEYPLPGTIYKMACVLVRQQSFFKL